MAVAAAYALGADILAAIGMEGRAVADIDISLHIDDVAQVTLRMFLDEGEAKRALAVIRRYVLCDPTDASITHTTYGQDVTSFLDDGVHQYRLPADTTEAADAES